MSNFSFNPLKCNSVRCFPEWQTRKVSLVELFSFSPVIWTNVNHINEKMPVGIYSGVSSVHSKSTFCLQSLKNTIFSCGLEYTMSSAVQMLNSLHQSLDLRGIKSPACSLKAKFSSFVIRCVQLFSVISLAVVFGSSWCYVPTLPGLGSRIGNTLCQTLLVSIHTMSLWFPTSIR